MEHDLVALGAGFMGKRLDRVAIGREGERDGAGQVAQGLARELAG
jgi:hypothetical protein